MQPHNAVPNTSVAVLNCVRSSKNDWSVSSNRKRACVKLVRLTGTPRHAARKTRPTIGKEFTS